MGQAAWLKAELQTPARRQDQKVSVESELNPIKTSEWPRRRTLKESHQGGQRCPPSRRPRRSKLITSRTVRLERGAIIVSEANSKTGHTGRLEEKMRSRGCLE